LVEGRPGGRRRGREGGREGGRPCLGIKFRQLGFGFTDYAGKEIVGRTDLKASEPVEEIGELLRKGGREGGREGGRDGTYLSVEGPERR